MDVLSKKFLIVSALTSLVPKNYYSIPLTLGVIELTKISN